MLLIKIRAVRLNQAYRDYETRNIFLMIKPLL